MYQITRRHMLGGLTGSALGAGPLAAADKAAEVKGVTFVVGPFSVAEWFNGCGQTFNEPHDPKFEDVAKALAPCRVYIIDRRVGEGKDAEFAEKGHPRVVLDGDLAGEWKNGTRTFRSFISRAADHGVDTYYQAGVAVRRMGGITLTLHIYGSDGVRTSYSQFAFQGKKPAITYDVNGVIRADQEK